MRVPSWLRPLAARLTPNAAWPTSRRPGFRPQVESLEARDVPTAGALDTSFGVGGFATADFLHTRGIDEQGSPIPADDEAWALAVQPADGKILVAGYTFRDATGRDFAVARFNTDGTLDNTFGSENNGRVTIDFGSPDDGAYGVVVQPDGRILVLGTAYDFGTATHNFAVARLSANGAPDGSFGPAHDGLATFSFGGTSQIAYEALLQGDRILVGGSIGNYLDGSFGLVALNNNDGSVDNSFGTAGDGRFVTPLWGSADYQPDGKIVIAGYNSVIRLTADGQPDESFGTLGVQALSFNASSVGIDHDGNIFVFGRQQRYPSGQDDFIVARFHGEDGSPDVSFGTGGEQHIDFDSGHEIALWGLAQADGKMVVIGWTEQADGYDIALTRLATNGDVDTSFGTGGRVLIPLAHANDSYGWTALQADGKILVPGSLYQTGTTYDFALVRLQGDNRPPAATVAGPATAVAGQQLTFALSATDPDQDPVAGYEIDWDGDGVPDPADVAGNTLTRTFADPGSYTFRVRARDAYEAGSWASYTVTVNAVSAANLQQVLPAGGGTVAIQATTQQTANDVVAAVNGLSPPAEPVTVVVNLGGGDFTGITASPPANVTLVFENGTFNGASPALTVTSGAVIVLDSTLTNTTDAPTILVTGGRLVIRDSVIQESTGYADAAVLVTGGTLDLGTAADPGNNNLNVNGPGSLIWNAGANPVSAVGNAWQVDGVALASGYLIEDRVFHALDAGGGGLVTWDAAGVYVTPASGSIQRGVNAVADGGVVNVAAGAGYAAYTVGTRLLTVAFQDGPTLTQQASAVHRGKTELVVVGTAGNDDLVFAPGGVAGEVEVGVNSLPKGTFAPTGRLVADGGLGDDDIQVAGGIRLDAWLSGGDGNDRLKGGSGSNVLLGGEGDDLLVGGSGQDILIGGTGADRLVGNAADDILIAGTTPLDAAALSVVLAEWTSDRTYAQRVANLTGTGTGTGFADRLNGNVFLLADQTVFDDGAADVMTGSSGQDWFWANLDTGVRDKVTDLSAAEFAADLDFILS